MFTKFALLGFVALAFVGLGVNDAKRAADESSLSANATPICCLKSAYCCAEILSCCRR